MAISLIVYISRPMKQESKIWSGPLLMKLTTYLLLIQMEIFLNGIFYNFWKVLIRSVRIILLKVYNLLLRNKLSKELFALRSAVYKLLLQLWQKRRLFSKRGLKKMRAKYKKQTKWLKSKREFKIKS